MKRKSAVLGALLVGLTSLAVVLFGGQGHGEKGKPVAKAPAQSEAKPESKDEAVPGAKRDSTLEWAEAPTRHARRPIKSRGLWCAVN